MVTIMTRSSEFDLPEDLTGELHLHFPGEAWFRVIHDVTGEFNNRPYDLKAGDEVWLNAAQAHHFGNAVHPLDDEI